MYPLLPAMQGTNVEIMKQAMAELAELYHEDEVSLSQQFIWMELLLERTTTISDAEKVRIQEGIKMYDPLWEEHPKVKKIKAEAKAEAEATTAQTLRDDLIKIVQIRFPELAELAQQTAGQITTPDTLSFLLVQVDGRTPRSAPISGLSFFLARLSSSRMSVSGRVQSCLKHSSFE